MNPKNKELDYDSIPVRIMRYSTDIIVGLEVASLVLENTSSSYLSVGFGILAGVIVESVINPLLWKLTETIRYM